MISTTSPKTRRSWSSPRATAPEARGLPAGALGLACAAALACVLALAPPAASSADTSEARAVLDETVEEVLSVLREDALSADERRRRIEQIAYARFDFETISRLVLARGWRDFDEDQRAEFVEEFKRHLSTSYGSRIERYDQESVAIVGERLEPRGDVTIQTRIRGGQFDGSAVDYRLRQRDGTWRVIDVIIEGVSLVSNFRSQFQDILARGGPDEVLRRLRERTIPLEDGSA